MTPSAPYLSHESVVDFWRRRFRRQRHVNAGVRSLLRKYGAASSSRAVSSDLLLTLMGNLIASDACFYRPASDGRALSPTVAFGSQPVETLPVIAVDTPFAQTAREGGPPRLLNSLPRAATDDPAVAPITRSFKLFAPLQFEDRLQGIVFLGGKVSGGAFTDNDVELIEALSAVTAAVLHYMDWQQAGARSDGRTTRLLNRCQEVAGGIADHLERTLTAIEALASGATDDADARGRLDRVSHHADAMRFLLSSLHLLASNPAALVDDENAGTGEAADVIEALQSTVMSFQPRNAPGAYSLQFRNEIESTRCAVAVPPGVAESAVLETLHGAFEQCGRVDVLGVHMDCAPGLPAEIGAADRSDPSQPVLRIRVETRGDAGQAGGKPGGTSGMKMLADNLEAFQTLREPAPHQATLVDSGGVIVWRRDDSVVVYLIYVPLVS